MPISVVVIAVLGAMALVGLVGWSVMNRELKPVPIHRYVAAAEHSQTGSQIGPSGPRQDQSLPRAKRDLLRE